MPFNRPFVALLQPFDVMDGGGFADFDAAVIAIGALVLADGGVFEVLVSKTDHEGQGAFAWLSAETMGRIGAWREAAAIRSGALFPRIGIIRQMAMAARRALSVSDLAYNAKLDMEQMAAQPPRHATTTYTVGT